MSKKAKTYILLIFALLVWGLIGYKIYRQLNPKTNDTFAIQSDFKYQPQVNTKKFTYDLDSGYRDPFLGTLKKKYKPTQNTTTQIPTKKEKPKKVKFPKCTYQGVVQPKTATKAGVYLINVNGKNELFNVGHSINDLRLLSANEKSIQLQYKDSIQSIDIKQ